MEPSPWPELHRLRSLDDTVSAAEWSLAYPLLYEAGARIAASRLSGQRWQSDREDLVSVALHQFVQGLIENNPESFKRISSWDDCLGMMRGIVRSRIADFHRTRSRRPEDAMEHPPEPLVAIFPGAGGDLAEDLYFEIDRLDPPLPELFRERFVEGLTIAEIAARRDINKNTVCTWFADALALLRKRLSTSVDTVTRP